MPDTKGDIYEFVSTFTDEHGFAPSLRQICEGVGVRSTSTVWKYLWMLRGEGKVTWEEFQSRTLRVL